MAWINLTVFDEHEKRVNIVRGFPWIFHTLTRDPRNIEDFIKAEIDLGGYSLLRDDNTGETYHKPWKNEGMKRSCDDGGTIIVNLPARIVTVKGHLAQSLDELNSGDEGYVISQNGKLVDPQTGERVYLNYGLLSTLREGIAMYELVIRENEKPKSFFDTTWRHVISDPKIPTKEDPFQVWVDQGFADDPDTYRCKLISRWQTPYSLGDSWKIRDGILHRDY